jgi:hypothetical protein
VAAASEGEGGKESAETLGTADTRRGLCERERRDSRRLCANALPGAPLYSLMLYSLMLPLVDSLVLPCTPLSLVLPPQLVDSLVLPCTHSLVLPGAPLYEPSPCPRPCAALTPESLKPANKKYCTGRLLTGRCS